MLALDDSTAIAICTDGVGTKLIVAEQAQRFDTVGIDCVAMNVNDLVCVGAEPIAMVDYIAVEQVDPRVLAEIGESSGRRRRAGSRSLVASSRRCPRCSRATRPRTESTSWERQSASWRGSDLTGETIEPEDVVLGVPSSGLHSNGFTLARRALLDEGGLSLEDSPAELGAPSPRSC